MALLIRSCRSKVNNNKRGNLANMYIQLKPIVKEGATYDTAIFAGSHPGCPPRACQNMIT